MNRKLTVPCQLRFWRACCSPLPRPRWREPGITDTQVLIGAFRTSLDPHRS